MHSFQSWVFFLSQTENKMALYHKTLTMKQNSSKVLKTRVSFCQNSTVSYFQVVQELRLFSDFLKLTFSELSVSYSEFTVGHLDSYY